MDKAEFVARAPIYYALAIAVALERSPGPMADFSIRGEYPDQEDTNPETGSLLDRGMIWERAVAWLLAREMIAIKTDPFGPPIFSQGLKCKDQWDELVKDESVPFSTYHSAGNTGNWLIPALYSVENHFVNMGITAEDFDNPDGEWAPIQIDADDPSVQRAIASLEKIIEEVRADNGYNATYPHERDYVLEGLQGTLGKFKSSTVSPGYIRIAVERLRTLSRRFAGTMKEVTIAAAKGALLDFAKKHFGDLLNYLWKIPF